MGKFNRSTAAGTPSTLDEASVQLPVEPSGGGSVLDGIIEQSSTAPSSPETAPEADVAIPTTLTEDPAVSAQREVDAVPSLRERQAAQDTGRYDYAGLDAERETQSRQRAAARLANSTPKPDGGFQQRALNMEQALNDPAIPVGLGALVVTAVGIV